MKKAKRSNTKAHTQKASPPTGQTLVGDEAKRRSRTARLARRRQRTRGVACTSPQNGAGGAGVGGVLTESEREHLEAIFHRGALKVKVFDAYWIHGADCGEDYCYQCCKSEVEKLKKKDPKGEYFVDGGWRSDHDGTPFCASCQKRLDGSLTNYGCKQEVDHFLEYGFDPNSDDDCLSMSEVICSRGWCPWSGRVYAKEYERERDERYFADLNTLGRRILGGGGAERQGDTHRSNLKLPAPSGLNSATAPEAAQ